MKKKIVLAGIWSRIAAHGIDLGCILAIALPIYFAAILPNTYRIDEYKANSLAVHDLYIDSGLYEDYTETVSGNLYYGADLTTIDSLHKRTVRVDNIETPVYILSGLYRYYTETRANYFNDPSKNLSDEVFRSNVLRVGESVSNIASFYIPEGDTHYAITCIDDGKASTTLTYVNMVFSAAVRELADSPVVKPYDEANTNMQVFSIWMLAPTVAVAALIFTFLVPLFMPNGKTLGKLAMHLIVLNGSGYEIKKWQLLPRSLAYIALELVGGVLSFGATFLVSYTMAMFMRKHRSFHDFIAYTVVADERRSLWFKDRLDEQEWMEEHPDEEPVPEEL